MPSEHEQSLQELRLINAKVTRIEELLSEPQSPEVPEPPILEPPAPDPDVEPPEDPEPPEALPSVPAEPTDAEGWTELRPVDHTLHVSEGGSDSNDGSSNSPYASISRALANVPSSGRTAVLLQRGSTFHGAPGRLSYNGCLGAYGDLGIPLPVIDNPGASGDTLQLRRDGFELRDVDVRGGQIAINAEGGTDPLLDVIIEGCHASRGGVQIRNNVRDLILRRNMIYDVNQAGNGLYTKDVHDYLVEENIIFNCGWTGSASQLTHNQGWYCSSVGDNGRIVGNIFAANANQGLKFRGPHASAEIRGNVFCLNRNAGELHAKNPGEFISDVSFVGNWVVETGHDAQHMPLFITSARSLLLEDNIFAHTRPEGFTVQAGLAFAHRRPGVSDDAITDLIVRNNKFYKIDAIVLHFRQNSGIDRALFEGNHIQFGGTGKPLVRFDQSQGTVSFRGNRWYHQDGIEEAFEVNGSFGTVDTDGTQHLPILFDVPIQYGQINYVSPERTVSTYNADKFSREADARQFLLRAIRQRKGAWHREYTAPALIEYAQEGYQVA